MGVARGDLPGVALRMACYGRRAGRHVVVILAVDEEEELVLDDRSAEGQSPGGGV